MMQKQTNLKTKIPTWQAKTKFISNEKIDQSRSNISKFDKTSMSLSQSSSSSLMSIRADSQVKQTRIQSTNNANLKPKSKLYKPSIIEKKNLPNFASKLNSNSLKKDRRTIKSNDLCAHLSNSKENQIPNQNHKTDLKSRIRLEKILREKNLCSKEMENKKSKIPMKHDKNISATNHNEPKSLVDHSIETWKESINEFKRKFSNIPKLNANGAKTSPDNKIGIEINTNKPKSTSPISNQEAFDKKYEPTCKSNSENLEKSCNKNTEKIVELRFKESFLSGKKIQCSKLSTADQILTNSTNESKPDHKEIKSEQMHCETSKKQVFRKKDDISTKENFNQNQEEILEEFKNSLNELIKASKWTRESQIGNCDPQMVTIHETSLNVEEKNPNESLTMRKSTTLSDHHAFNVLNFKNQTFSIDKSKSSEFSKLSSNLPSDLNSSLYIQTPQVSKQTDSIGNQIVSPLSTSPSVLNTSLAYSSDSTKSSLLNIRSTSSNNLSHSSSSSSTTLQTQNSKQPKNEHNLLTSTKRFSKPKSVYLAKEDILNDIYHIDAIKRFSTTSEILSKRPSNKDLVEKKISTFQSNLKQNQRKSTHRLSTSESMQSFQMVDKNPQLICLQNSQDPRRFSEMKNSNSKSLNKFQFESNSIATVTPFRKSANSWIAQSFRKAFSKIDKKKMKSQSHLNQFSKNTVSTLSINCNEVSNEKSNSDDENEKTLKHKLSLPRGSHDCLNDSESEFDDDQNFKKIEFVSKHSKNLIMTKRSYRSESELAFKNLKQKELNINQLSNNTGNLITIDNNMSKIREGKIPVKLKNHKSVSSLLTTSISSNQILDQMNSRQKQNLNIQESMAFSSNSPQKLINKCNCKLNESMITDLKNKLNNAENKLTDIRLEALSSIHQIDQLKECMDKMKDEMVELKSENNLLKKCVQETKCDHVDISKANELLKNYDSRTEADLSDKIFEMLQSVNKNMTNYYYAYNFLLSDENETLLRKALVTIDCSYQLQFSSNSDISINSYRLCTINIDSKLKWPLMDGIVSYIFRRYISQLDQTKSIDLNQYSIDKYQIGDMVRRIKDPKQPDLLPFGYLIGNNCVIKIFLKDNSNHLDALAYETLIPRYLLEDYVSILEKHKLLAISGLFKFGKTYLMYKLSQFVSKNSEKNFEIFYLNIDELTGYMCNKSSSTNLMNTLMSKIDEKLIFLDQLNRTLIILLDNFDTLFNRDDFDSAYFLNYISHIKNKYKWINLNIKYEEFLQLYLNRNLINYQVENYKAKQSCAIMEKVVWFTCEVYRLLNEFISKLGLKNYILMPTSFMNIPFGIEVSEKWFIENWNYSIIPYLNDLLKYKKESDVPRQSDPVEWIIKNYVWSKNSNSISINQRLQRIKIDEKYMTRGIRASAISNDSDLSSTDFPSHSDSGAHLVSMLLKLQQATSLTCKDENISSGYYDSSSSSASTSSTSPNFNFKQKNSLVLNSLTNKSKIESSL